MTTRDANNMHKRSLLRCGRQRPCRCSAGNTRGVTPSLKSEAQTQSAVILVGIARCAKKMGGGLVKDKTEPFWCQETSTQVTCGCEEGGQTEREERARSKTCNMKAKRLPKAVNLTNVGGVNVIGGSVDRGNKSLPI